MSTPMCRKAAFGRLLSKVAGVVVRLAWRLVRAILVVTAVIVSPFVLPPPPPPPRPPPEKNDDGQPERKR